MSDDKAVHPPTCKVCGKKHWMREPHDFGRAAAPKTDPNRKPRAKLPKRKVKAKAKAKAKTRGKARR